MQCTEQVTKGIQQLWKCIQGPQRDECIPCADRIKLAVSNLTAAVPAVTMFFFFLFVFFFNVVLTTI